MERYEVLKDLGSGNFGVAKLVKEKSTGELFAVKFIERGQKVIPLTCSLIKSFYFCFGDFCLIDFCWNLIAD